MTTETTPANPDITNLTRCYGLLIIGTPLTFFPLALWSMLGLVLWIIGIIWAYVMLKGDNPSPLVADHARWMVRTFWISALFCGIAVMLAGFTSSGNINPAALNQLNTMMSGETMPTTEQIQAQLSRYFEDNKPVLLWASIAYMLVPVLYTVGRYVHGFRLARDGKPLPNVKTWSV